MKYIVGLSKSAIKDIDEIYEYVALTLGEKNIAVNLINQIEKSIFSLSEMPERFRFYDGEPWKNRGVHIMTVKKYIVFYTVCKKEKTVDILRVVYGSRELDNIQKV